MSTDVRDQAREHLFDALEVANDLRDDDGSYCCLWRDLTPPLVLFDDGAEAHPVAFVATDARILYLMPDEDIAHPELVGAAVTSGWDVQEGKEVLS